MKVHADILIVGFVGAKATSQCLRSHHYFAREFLFDRGDLEGNQFGDPLTPWLHWTGGT